MSRYVYVLLFVMFFSFIWGAGWGYYKKNKEGLFWASAPTVRWLGLKGTLPESVVQQLNRKLRVRLVVTEKENESDLLREALSHNNNYDLIQINTFVVKSFLIDNVFKSLNHELLLNESDISADFKSLDYDLDNRFLLPLTWGIRGFITNQQTSFAEESLEEILDIKQTKALFKSPFEVFHLVSKIRPVIKTWVETGQKDELKTVLRELKPKLNILSEDPAQLFRDDKVQLAQVTNGEVADLIKGDAKFKFYLPKDRAVLWIQLVGVSRGAQDVELAHQILNALYDPSFYKMLILENKQASVLESLNSSDLPILQKAHFIREVPLSRVELFINREAIEPTWLQTLQSELNF